MSKPDDKDPKDPTQPRREKISYDSRGNPVWQWAVDSGRHLIESTSLLLKRLEVPGLRLEGEETAEKKKVEPNSGKLPSSSKDAGYDPYGNKRVTPPRPLKKPVAAPPPRRSWWQRWFRRD